MNPEPIKMNDRNYLLKILLMFLGTYVLFAISVLVSILYTEHTYFHHFLINAYVRNKVFSSALQGALVVFITTHIFQQILRTLHIYRQPTLRDGKGLPYSIKGSLFLNLIIFILVSGVFIPLKTVIVSFYVGTDGTYFRLNFVHFSTETKIITAIIGLSLFVFYVSRKYTFKTMSLLALLAILVSPIAYGIYSTQAANFAALEEDIIAVSNSGLYTHDAIVNPEMGAKLKPKAEKLLAVASNDKEKGSAYEWLAITELSFGHFDAALEYLNKAEVLDPHDSRKYRTKAQVYRASGQYAKAREAGELCAKIAEENKTPRNVALCEGEIAASFMEEGEKTYGYKNGQFFVDARTHYERAALLDPEQVFLQKALDGMLLDEAIKSYFNSDFKTATAKLDEYIAKSDPATYADQVSRAYALRGTVELWVGEEAKGVADYEHSLTVYPDDNKAALADLGEYFLKKNNSQKAKDYLTQALQFDPNDVHTPSNQELQNLLKTVQ